MCALAVLTRLANAAFLAKARGRECFEIPTAAGARAGDGSSDDDSGCCSALGKPHASADTCSDASAITRAVSAADGDFGADDKSVPNTIAIAAADGGPDAAAIGESYAVAIAAADGASIVRTDA